MIGSEFKQMIPENSEAVLRKTQLFARLTESEMRMLCARVSKRHFGRGETLFSEGDPCHGLFVVAMGRIRIFKLSASGREQVLAVEGPGNSFAELPVFDGDVYPASASALEDAEVLFISRKDFQNYCREHPEVALKVLAVVGSRLRRLVGIIEDLSFTTVRQRLISLLLRLAQEGGSATRQGIRVELTTRRLYRIHHRLRQRICSPAQRSWGFRVLPLPAGGPEFPLQRCSMGEDRAEGLPFKGSRS